MGRGNGSRRFNVEIRCHASSYLRADVREETSPTPSTGISRCLSFRTSKNRERRCKKF